MAHRLPPLNALRAFEAAARHGSFARAADELAVTPAAVSQQIRLLEADLGVSLFNRLPRGLILTEAGRGGAARAGQGLRASRPGGRGHARRLGGGAARDLGHTLLRPSLADPTAVQLHHLLPRHRPDPPGGGSAPWISPASRSISASVTGEASIPASMPACCSPRRCSRSARRAWSTAASRCVAWRICATTP